MISLEDALALTDDPHLLMRAAAVRDRRWGRRLTYSPKVFLPLTNLCPNRCDYCSFRKLPNDDGAWTMTPREVEEWLARAQQQGCTEALFCLGDKPERAWRSYRAQLAGWGFSSTVDYLVWASQAARAHGLLPHTNAGILSRDDMRRLVPLNPSLGLMLESVSERLCEPGMPHHRAPDKRPSLRLKMLREAGELRVPMTTGILVGIGETVVERAEALFAIAELHVEFGHIQEVIVQSFRARPGIAMTEEPEDAEVAHAIAMARLILPEDVTVQAPPNLNPNVTTQLIGAGINDFGGISPVTPDYINPRHPWPHVDALAVECARLGFSLEPRLPVHETHRAWVGL